MPDILPGAQKIPKSGKVILSGGWGGGVHSNLLCSSHSLHKSKGAHKHETFKLIMYDKLIIPWI